MPAVAVQIKPALPMAPWTWFYEGCIRVIDRFLDNYYLPFEDSLFKPIEDVIGMDLGSSSRAFFPSAVLVQLFLVCAHASNGFSTINYPTRVLIAFGAFVYVCAMFYFAVESLLAIGGEMRLQQMPRARYVSDIHSSHDFMMIFALASLIPLLLTISQSGFFGWYLCLNIIMACLTAATTMKHMQACYTLLNKDDLPKVFEDQERLKEQSRQIVKMESTIEGQNYRLHQGLGTLEAQAWKLSMEKKDLAAELAVRESRINSLRTETWKLKEGKEDLRSKLEAKNAIIGDLQTQIWELDNEKKDLVADNASKAIFCKQLLDGTKEYQDMIEWHSQRFHPDQALIKRLSSENSELESQNQVLTESNAKLKQQNASLENCLTVAYRERKALIDDFTAKREQSWRKHKACADALSIELDRLYEEKKRAGEHCDKTAKEYQAQVELLKRDNGRLRRIEETWIAWYDTVFAKRVAAYEQACDKIKDLDEHLEVAHITLEACRLTLAKKEEDLQQTQLMLKQYEDVAKEVTKNAETEAEVQPEKEMMGEVLANEELEEEYDADEESDVESYAEVNEVASEVEYDESDVEILTDGDSDDEIRHWALIDSDNEL